MVTVNVFEVGRAIVWLCGDAAMVKSGAVEGFTTSVTVVECVCVALVPVTVSV
jgi:hypothetical protein